MLGKGPTQLLRLSGILQALHDAFDYVMNTSTEKFELTINFSNDLQVFLETNPLKTISIDNVNRAYKLLEYFNKHKLVLAGYEIDINDDIKDIFTQLIEMNTAVIEEEAKTIEQQIACLIMLAPTVTVLLNDDVNQKMQKAVSMPLITKVCISLEKCGLGSLKSIANTNGRPTKIFEKIFIENFDVTMVTNIQSFRIDLDQFKSINSGLAKVATGKYIYFRQKF